MIWKDFFHCFASQASLRIKLNCDLCRGKNCNRDHDLSVVISSKSFRTALIIMEVALELMCLSHHFLKLHYDVVIAVRDISSNAIETYVWENTAKSLWKEGRRCTKNSSNAVSFCHWGQTSLVYFDFAYGRMGKAGLAMDDWQGLICLLSTSCRKDNRRHSKISLKVQLKSH